MSALAARGDGPRLPPAFPTRGGVVRVVHPCGAVGPHLDRVAEGVEALRGAGVEVRWDEAGAGREWRGYLAGDEEERLEELLEALVEPGVDAVWVARGGSGAQRYLRRLLRRAEEVPPRILVGFSDATTLLNALAVERGWVAFHGPVVASLGSGGPDVALSDVLDVLRGFGARVSTPVGRLLGGNLTVLASLVGVLAAPPGPVVWVLEDVAEPAYKLDRCVTQLREGGWFRASDHYWLGDFGEVPADVVGTMLCEDLNACHVNIGAPAGHGGRLGALPIGALVGGQDSGYLPVGAWVGG